MKTFFRVCANFHECLKAVNFKWGLKCNGILEVADALTSDQCGLLSSCTRLYYCVSLISVFLHGMVLVLHLTLYRFSLYFSGSHIFNYYRRCSRILGNTKTEFCMFSIAKRGRDDIAHKIVVLLANDSEAAAAAASRWHEVRR